VEGGELMADHVRQQIVDEVVATLKAAGTDAGSRVYPSRLLPVRPDGVPAIYVYAHEEDGGERPHAGAPYQYDRTLTVATHCLVKADTGEALEEALNALVLQVETAMNADLTRGGLADETFYASLKMDLWGDGYQPMAQGQLLWAVKYLY
jgi:hypothetical protein